MIPNIIPIKQPCKSHKRESSYIKWQAEAEQKKLKGEKQTQCKTCGRWYFKDEM